MESFIKLIYIFMKASPPKHSSMYVLKMLTMMGNVCYGSYEGVHCLHKAAMGSAREMRENPPYNPKVSA